MNIKITKSIKKRLKKFYFSKLILKYKNNIKKTWPVIEKAIWKKKIQTTKSFKKDPSGQDKHHWIMYNRLYKYLTDNSMLYKKQFCLQEEDSTEHAIVQLVDQIRNNFESKQYT